MTLRRGFTPFRLEERRRGFTLIELLVVIAIVVIVVATTIFLVGRFFRGSSVKQGGQVVAGAFARGRQQASSTRLMHYLVFDFGNNTMRLHSDTNRDKAFTNVDPVVGEPTPLPGNVYFDRICGQKTGSPYVAFQPDGSVAFHRSDGTIYPDISWANPAVAYREGGDEPPKRSDIALRHGSALASAPDKVYIDVQPVTGLIRKMEYYRGG